MGISSLRDCHLKQFQTTLNLKKSQFKINFTNPRRGKNNIDTGVSPWQNATIMMNPEGMTQNASTLRLRSGSGISAEPWRAAAKSHRINRFHISRSMLRLYELITINRQTSFRLRSGTKWFGCCGSTTLTNLSEPKHRKYIAMCHRSLRLRSGTR